MQATSAPRSVNSRTNARPRPAVPPVMATRLPTRLCIEVSHDWMQYKIEVQVSLKSSPGRGYLVPHAGSVDHHRSITAQRRGLVRAAVLRGARADPLAARRIGAPAF